MSVVTNLQYIKRHYVKNKYEDDYFEGYMITTSDDIEDNTENISDTDYFEDITEKTSDNLTMVFPQEYSKITNFFVLISDSVNCCENFGVDMAKKDNFIGSTIKKITFGKTTKINDSDKTEYEYDNNCIIDVHTDRGLFKFVIYNNYNGYYPHTAYFSVNNYVHSERL